MQETHPRLKEALTALVTNFEEKQPQVNLKAGLETLADGAKLLLLSLADGNAHIVIVDSGAKLPYATPLFNSPYNGAHVILERNHLILPARLTEEEKKNFGGGYPTEKSNDARNLFIPSLTYTYPFVLSKGSDETRYMKYTLSDIGEAFLKKYLDKE